MITRTVCLLFTFFFVLSTHANTFQDRFELTQNSKGETVLNDKKLFEDVSVLNFVSYLKEIFDNGEFRPIDEMNLQCIATTYDKKSEEMYKLLKKTIELMSKFKFDSIVNSEGFAKFLAKFDDEINNFISKEELRSLANLDNSKYFYVANTQGYIVGKLKGFIKDNISMPGGVKLALFFGETYEKYVFQKREYNQNILLSYLLTLTPEQMGLSQAQVDQAVSSIFESRIRVKNFFAAKKESKKAQNNWLGYGKEKVSDLKNVAQKRWAKNKKVFETEIRRIEPLFSIARFKASPIYINLGEKLGSLTAKPALTFDEACPDYNYIKRYGYGLVRIGMDVLGVPFSGTIDKLLIEQYQNQVPLEGLLYGVLEIENSNLTKDLRRQAMNPFLK